MQIFRLIIFMFCYVILFNDFSSNKHPNDKIYYIIEHPEKQINIEKIELVNLPPPPPFYSFYNFILLDTTKIFYHSKYIDYTGDCLTDHTTPVVIDLIPENLIEIKIDSLKRFLDKTIATKQTSSAMNYITISSPSDTIKNRAFTIITEYKNQKKFHLNIRNWTEEEQYVLDAKMSNKPYHPDSVKWKNSFYP